MTRYDECAMARWVPVWRVVCSVRRAACCLKRWVSFSLLTRVLLLEDRALCAANVSRGRFRKSTGCSDKGSTDCHTLRSCAVSLSLLTSGGRYLWQGMKEMEIGQDREWGVQEVVHDGEGYPS